MAAPDHETQQLTRPLLSLRQTARWLGVSPWTVRRLVDRGELEMIVIGGQLRFAPEAIEAFLEANRRGSPK